MRIYDKQIGRAPERRGDGAARLAGENDVEAAHCGRLREKSLGRAPIGPRLDEREGFKRRINDLGRGRHPRLEAFGQKLHLGVYFKKVPDQAGAEVDRLFELRERYRVRSRKV